MILECDLISFEVFLKNSLFLSNNGCGEYSPGCGELFFHVFLFGSVKRGK